MTEDELTDRILRICHEQGKPVHIKTYLETEDSVDITSSNFKQNFTGAIKTLKHYDLILEKASLIGGDKLITTSPAGHNLVSDYESFSFWKESKEKTIKKQVRESKLKLFLLIIGSIGVVASILLGILNFKKDRTIDRQLDQIRDLENDIDSLKNGIKKNSDPTTLWNGI